MSVAKRPESSRAVPEEHPAAGDEGRAAAAAKQVGRLHGSKEERQMLKVTLKEGESLAIGGNITVELKQIATSRRATILIDAPREVPVKRQKAEGEAVGAKGR